MNPLLRRFLFAGREALRNLGKDKKQSLTFFALSLFNLILIGGNFIVLININYLIEVFSTRPLNKSLVLSLVPVVNKIYYFKTVHYFLFFFFISCFFILNRFYLSRFIKNYQDEIYLISKLGADRKIGKSPIVYLAVFINGLATILSWLFLNLIYRNLYDLAVNKYIGFSLLSFNYFNITLFALLFILSLGSVFLFIYFLYLRIISHK